MPKIDSEGVVTRAWLAEQSAVARMTEIGKWNVKGLSRDAEERGFDIGKGWKC